MKFRRMPIEIESLEQLGYDTIANNLRPRGAPQGCSWCCSMSGPIDSKSIASA